MGERIRNPSPDPSPKRGGEQEGLPLPASGRGVGGGVAPIGPAPRIRLGERRGVSPPVIAPAPVRNTVIGQRVDPAKVLRAKELRRQMTPAERRLWNCLRANRLGGLQFRRQQVIDGFIVDFYCHAAAVVVEVDGPVHVDQVGYDAERDHVLTARGLRVIRFTNEQVNRSLPDVLRQIEAMCRGG